MINTINALPFTSTMPFWENQQKFCMDSLYWNRGHEIIGCLIHTLNTQLSGSYIFPFLQQWLKLVLTKGTPCSQKEHVHIDLFSASHYSSMSSQDLLTTFSWTSELDNSFPDQCLHCPSPDILGEDMKRVGQGILNISSTYLTSVPLFIYLYFCSHTVVPVHNLEGTHLWCLLFQDNHDSQLSTTHWKIPVHLVLH